LTKQDSSI